MDLTVAEIGSAARYILKLPETGRISPSNLAAYNKLITEIANGTVRNKYRWICIDCVERMERMKNEKLAYRYRYRSK
jgi:hypothetical protein